jgi:hypothetical protein
MWGAPDRWAMDNGQWIIPRSALDENSASEDCSNPQFKAWLFVTPKCFIAIFFFPFFFLCTFPSIESSSTIQLAT